jgi:hypothetical protein
MQTITSNHATFLTSEAVPIFRRVKIAGATRKISLADAEEAIVGVTISDTAAAADDASTVRFKGDPGTFEIEAAGVIAAGAVVYGAADGKVDDSGTTAIGVALTASAAAGETVEVLFT